MEQYYPHYNMMWMNNKHPPNSYFHRASSTNTSSWEEKAFADDAAGLLGGFVWPPRCYSCSFCRRDFRSAQALGGHMNVHRRERAKLKQTHTNTSASKTPPQSTKVCFSLDSSPNPNANPSFDVDASLSPSLSRVSSTISTQENSTSEAHVDTKLSMGLGLATSQSDSSSRGVLISCEPQKSSLVSERPSFLKDSSLEDIDLELRLGLA